MDNQSQFPQMPLRDETPPEVRARIDAEKRGKAMRERAEAYFQSRHVFTGYDCVTVMVGFAEQEIARATLALGGGEKQ